MVVMVMTVRVDCNSVVIIVVKYEVRDSGSVGGCYAKEKWCLVMVLMMVEW